MPSDLNPEPSVAPLSVEPLPLRSGAEYLGRTLDGRYRLERLLGRGGMGAVYFARHVAVGRPLAVKLLSCRQASTDGMTRILREAQSAAAIGHPNIVDIIDVGISSLGDPYLVMEYLEGEDLQSFMQHEGALPMAAACAIVEPVLHALAAAHRKGVVHRDLKPANIYLVRRDDGSATVKLIDFGIAKLIDGAMDGKLTLTGALLGTPSYMSPEQAVGVIDVDERVDLYAVGVVLYQLVAGRLPFEGANYNEIIFRILNDVPQPPEAIPGMATDAGAVIRKAICKNPSSRYQSAMELLDALKGLDAWATRERAFSQLAARVQTTGPDASTIAETAAQHRASRLPAGANPVGSRGADGLPDTPVVPHRGALRLGATASEDPSAHEGAGAEVVIDEPVLLGSAARAPSPPLRIPEVEATRVSPRNESLEAGCERTSLSVVRSADSDDAPGPAWAARSGKPRTQGASHAAGPSPGALEDGGAPQPTTNDGVTASPATAERRFNLLAGTFVIASAAIAAIAIWNLALPRSPAPALRDSPAGREPAEGVLITVNGAPVGATVYYDGAPVSTNPFRARASSAMVPIRIEAHGFEPFAASIVPTENTTVSVSMRRSAAHTTPGASSASSPNGGKPGSGRELTTSDTGDTNPGDMALRPGRRTSAQSASDGSAAPDVPGAPSAAMQRSGRGTLYTDVFE